MKQIVFSVMFIMTFCVNGMYAQNVEDVDSVDVSATTDGVAGAKEDDSSSENSQKQFKTDNFEYADVLVSKFKNMLDANQKEDEEPDIFLPLGKKRNWFLTQRIGISLLGGSDNDLDDDANKKFDQEDLSDKRDVNDGKFSGGFAGEYTLSFVRGKMEGESIKLNPLGFALNTGFVASFDKQKEAMTCDLMAKIGIEAGFNHNMGFGFDFLVGTGKSQGVYYYLIDTSPEGQEPTDDDLEIEDEPYTAWCAKFGGQLWFRTGLFSGMGKNRDIHLFVRYVYSKDPHKATEYSAAAFQNDWFEESWQIGLTYFYKF